MSFDVGQSVLIPCSVQPGAFPDESLVTIEFASETLSGFVQNRYLQGQAVRGTVLDTGPEWITVRVPGSFFTQATGKTLIPAAWASDHLQTVSA